MDVNRFFVHAAPTPNDIDRALSRLKRDLTIQAMKRALLGEELDGRSALHLTSVILELQTDA